MVSQAELKKRRVKTGKTQIHQEQVVDRAKRRRRLWVTFGVGVLSLALIAPLLAGLIAFFEGDDEPAIAEIPELELDTTPPSLVDPGFEGATLTGATPCPATDGTQERVTSFETAPAGCLDAGTTYSTVISTVAGDATIELDAAGTPEATDLFVSLARYGVYEGAPITSFDGLSVIGGFGDAGFSAPATEPPADGVYPIGSVVMLTELGSGLLGGQIVVVTNQLGADNLATDPTSPIIGSVSDGLDVFEAIADLSIADQTSTFRVRTTEVTESAG